MNSLLMRAVLGGLPILTLIYLMTKRSSMPSHKALPLSALFTYCIVTVFLAEGLRQVHATVIAGLLTALTPISIIWGAIFLFRTMEQTGALESIRQWLNSISPNPIVQLMIVGWAFPFLIEGASGFGTPAALAAPILVGLGFDAVKVALFSLVMNSVPVSFGAVGTPIWFGFAPLSLSQSELLHIGLKSAIIHSCAAVFVPVFALWFLLDLQTIRKNLLFIYLSIALTVIPFALVSLVSYEFPALIGGGVGLVGTVLITSFFNSGERSEESKQVEMAQLGKALFPLAATVFVLLLTRLPQLPFKALLTTSEPQLSLSMVGLGELSVSAGLVVKLQNILGVGESWTHQLLYVPSFIPFILVSIVTAVMYKSPAATLSCVTRNSLSQMKNPTIALLGALVFVKLLMMGDDNSIVYAIGSSMADLTGKSWTGFAAYLGALGSFFSGSATISNLTFGGIQNAIAQSNKLNVTTVLALQSVGAAMGNMVCINNIVAVCSVLGPEGVEGVILKKTFGITVFYGVLAAIVGFFLL